MSMLLRWLFTLLDGLGLALAMSYLLRVRNLRRDWWSVQHAAGAMRRWVRGWRIYLRDLAGMTDAAWLRLRDQYRAGRFGIEGT